MVTEEPPVSMSQDMPSEIYYGRHTIMTTPGVNRIMNGVLKALIPGIIVQIWQYGIGVIIQCILGVIAAILFEMVALKSRKRPVLSTLGDSSAIVTAVLLCISIPCISPWWVSVIGTGFAILIGKHIYGGLGHNPFNPAMLGYAVLLLAFPREMSAWPTPTSLLSEATDLINSLTAIVAEEITNKQLDAITMATSLDFSRAVTLTGQDIDTLHASTFPTLRSSVLVNMSFFAGGLWLLHRRWIDWRIPASVLGSIFSISLVLYLLNPQTYPTPLYQLFCGATQLAAFFIATDPVSSAATPRGRIVYGFGIGTLIVTIRNWGGYPDGVAFAVLLMNFASPTIDRFTRPRVYGHNS